MHDAVDYDLDPLLRAHSGFVEMLWVPSKANMTNEISGWMLNIVFGLSSVDEINLFEFNTFIFILSIFFIVGDGYCFLTLSEV